MPGEGLKKMREHFEGLMDLQARIEERIRQTLAENLKVY